MSRRSQSSYVPPERSSNDASQPLGAFLRDIVDDANDTLGRVQRDMLHLRDLKERASIGIRAVGDAAKEEVDETFDHFFERLRQRIGRTR